MEVKTRKIIVMKFLCGLGKNLTKDDNIKFFQINYKMDDIF